MPWSRLPWTRGTFGWRLTFCVVILLASARIVSFSSTTGSSATAEKKISVYSSAANYSLTMVERNGFDYIGLLELLEPLGTVTSKASGKRWKFEFNGIPAECNAGDRKARIGGTRFDLPANFLLENGRGLIPLSSLEAVLSRFLTVPVSFHQDSRRLFVGDVGVHFVAKLNEANPPALVLDFTSRVNPSISTEPGQLRMLFAHDPVMSPASTTLTFNNKVIPSATFKESNGEAEIVIPAGALLASFSNDGRTITIAPAPGQPGQIVHPGASAPIDVLAAGGNAARPRRYFAVIDASHGGSERGAALGDQLGEKDVTLAIARELRQELENRGVSTLLLRDGDNTMTLDQRANLTNAAHPAIYICVHAAVQGIGVRVYTSLIPVGDDNRGAFVDWKTAQTNALSSSEGLAATLSAGLRGRKIPVRSMAAPLRPLNNVTVPAVAVEVAPGEGGLADLTSPIYQKLIASSLAIGVSEIRDKLGAGH